MTDRDTVEHLAQFWNREPWEPWKPRVGQRVVIRLSAECRVVPERGSELDGLGIVGHPAWQDGLTGRVVRLVPVTNRIGGQGHRYGVFWDDPQSRSVCLGGVYAACELIPLGQEDDR